MKDSYEAPKLENIGTVAELTAGGGTDNPEQAGSTFPIKDA